MFALLLFFSLISTTESFTDSLHNNFPWIGVLRLRTTDKKHEAITGITIIAKGVAIANSYEMDVLFKKKELRSHVIATFLSGNREQWYCKVRDIIFHPEHNTATKNSLALVFLEPASWADWKHIRLPHAPVIGSEDAYYIALTDKTSKSLTLSVTPMDPVEHSKCYEFYEDEGLNSKWMQPVHYNCYRTHDDDDGSCVNDAGMVLALPENDTVEWTLLGISIHGPGCSLPARFIDIFPYTPWIKYYLPKNHDPEDNEVIAMGSRRFYDKYQSAEHISGSEFDDRDSYILSQIDNTSVVLAHQSAYTKGGTCNISDLFVYEDEGEIHVGKYKYATAIYSVSLYDVRAAKIDCVIINITCHSRSTPNIYYKMGFGEEDWHTFVKVQPKDPENHNNTQKILFAQDEWMNYVENETFTLWLKFDIMGSAFIRAKYYGALYRPPPPTTTIKTTSKSNTTLGPGTTTTTPKTRLPRKYQTHLRRTTTKARLRSKNYTEAPSLLKKKNKLGSKRRGHKAKIETAVQLERPKLGKRVANSTTTSNRKKSIQPKNTEVTKNKPGSKNRGHKAKTETTEKLERPKLRKIVTSPTTRNRKKHVQPKKIEVTKKRTAKKTDKVKSNNENSKNIKHKIATNQTSKLNKPLNNKTKIKFKKTANLTNLKATITNKKDYRKQMKPKSEIPTSLSKKLFKEVTLKKRQHNRNRMKLNAVTSSILPTVETGNDWNYR